MYTEKGIEKQENEVNQLTYKVDSQPSKGGGTSCSIDTDLLLASMDVNSFHTCTYSIQKLLEMSKENHETSKTETYMGECQLLRLLQGSIEHFTAFIFLIN